MEFSIIQTNSSHLNDYWVIIHVAIVREKLFFVQKRETQTYHLEIFEVFINFFKGISLPDNI